MSNQIPGNYNSFEYYTRLVAEHHLLTQLENLVFVIDRPQYAAQQSLWIASAYILKNKMEEDLFESKVLVATKKEKVSAISIEALLNPARWNQVIDLKHYGTIDEGKYLHGTVFVALQTDKRLFSDQERVFHNRFINEFVNEAVPFIEEFIGETMLQDIKNISNENIKEKISSKFQNYNDMFLRELVTHLRREYR